MTYTTTSGVFDYGIGLLDADQLTKLFIACQDAIKEQYPVPGEKDIFSKVHDRGQYGAYRLTISQMVDAGWIAADAIDYINKKLVDHPEGPEKIESRKSYFESAKEYNDLAKKVDFAEAKIEAKNTAQYYFIANKLENIATKETLTLGADVLLSGKMQDSIAYDYLNFVYDLFLTARIITPKVDEKVTAGLLAVALCVNYDTALNYANGIIKKDTNGISSKYWYDIGWNSVASKPLKISVAKPDVPDVPVVEGGLSFVEKSVGDIRVEYSIVGTNISGKIFFGDVELASSMPVSVESLSSQLDKVIQATKIVGPKEKYLILQSAKQQLLSTFEEDIAPIKKQLNITDPIVTTTTDGDGNTITTTVVKNPDGTTTTTVETVNADGTIRTKDKVQEKIPLETKPEEKDLTDPPKTEVPVAARDDTVGEANSVDTYRANNVPLNTDVVPEDDTKGFKDPNKVYPKKDSVNKPDTNPLATGINSPGVAGNPKVPSGDKESLSAGASPAARNATRKREVQTAGRNGATWSQPQSPYNAQYPYNKVFGSESGHAIEIDDSPGSERLNWAHRSGTFDEIGPDGTKVTKIVGDGYTILDKNGYIMIEGMANVHVAGNCNVIIMSDTNLTMHGRVSMDFHNDVDVNIAGRLSLSVGEGIYARNGGLMSLENVGDIDIETKGNMTTDVVGKFNLTTDGGLNMTSKGDTHMKSAGSFFNHSTGDMNMCTDAAIKTKSGAATEVKSGAAVNVEGAGNISLKAPLVTSSPIDTTTIDVSTANITTLNAGTTNLKGTHNSPDDTTNIKGNTTANVTAPAAAAEAVCAEPAPLANIKTVEKPISRSSSGNSQFVGGSSGGVGGGTSADNSYNDVPGEEDNSDVNCVAANGETSGSDPTTPGDPGTGTGDAGGDFKSGNIKASPACDTMSNGKKLTPLIKSGRPSSGIRLSDNFILDDFVTRPHFKKVSSCSQIRSYTRDGITQDPWDIVQNYRCLALNILEPVIKEFGRPIITSGYRPGNGNSAHAYAAIDVQWSKYDKRKHVDIARWISERFAHDQILAETANRKTAWVHIGYFWYNRSQRGQHFSAVQSSKANRLGSSPYRFVYF